MSSSVHSITGVCLMCRLAILARDKQSLRYATLLDRQPAEQQLVSLAPAGAAAGIAIHTKQAVNVRDINTG